MDLDVSGAELFKFDVAAPAVARIPPFISRAANVSGTSLNANVSVESAELNIARPAFQIVPAANAADVFNLPEPLRECNFVSAGTVIS